MDENKRRSIVLIIIAIATLALVVGMATYAFFATGQDLDNGIINANVGTAASMYQFTAESNSEINMTIDFNEMPESGYSTEKKKSDYASINVSLASPSDEMLTVCTYDLVWVWDSEDKYTTPDVQLPYTHIDNNIYNYEFSTEVDTNGENDLSKLSRTDSRIILQEGLSIRSTSTNPVKIIHTIYASVYNLPVDQKNLFDKNFKAHITVDNLECSMVTDNKGPVYKSGGAVSNGSIADSVWEDESNDITLYYAVTPTNSNPGADAITLTSQTLDMTTTCGEHYVWAKAVDKHGNYTIRNMGNYDSAGTWSNSGSCSSQGWQTQTRTNACTNTAESKQVACQSAYTYGDWGSCDNYGMKTRTVSYFYGGNQYFTSPEIVYGCDGYNDPVNSNRYTYQYYDCPQFYVTVCQSTSIYGSSAMCKTNNGVTLLRSKLTTNYYSCIAQR